MSISLHVSVFTAWEATWIVLWLSMYKGVGFGEALVEVSATRQDSQSVSQRVSLAVNDSALHVPGAKISCLWMTR